VGGIVFEAVFGSWNGEEGRAGRRGGSGVRTTASLLINRSNPIQSNPIQSTTSTTTRRRAGDLEDELVEVEIPGGAGGKGGGGPEGGFVIQVRHGCDLGLVI